MPNKAGNKTAAAKAKKVLFTLTADQMVQSDGQHWNLSHLAKEAKELESVDVTEQESKSGKQYYRAELMFKDGTQAFCIASNLVKWEIADSDGNILPGMIGAEDTGTQSNGYTVYDLYREA